MLFIFLLQAANGEVSNKSTPAEFKGLTPPNYSVSQIKLFWNLKLMNLPIESPEIDEIMQEYLSFPKINTKIPFEDIWSKIVKVKEKVEANKNKSFYKERKTSYEEYIPLYNKIYSKESLKSFYDEALKYYDKLLTKNSFTYTPTDYLEIGLKILKNKVIDKNKGNEESSFQMNNSDINNEEYMQEIITIRNTILTNLFNPIQQRLSTNSQSIENFAEFSMDFFLFSAYIKPLSLIVLHSMSNPDNVSSILKFYKLSLNPKVNETSTIKYSVNNDNSVYNTYFEFTEEIDLELSKFPETGFYVTKSLLIEAFLYFLKKLYIQFYTETLMEIQKTEEKNLSKKRSDTSKERFANIAFTLEYLLSFFAEFSEPNIKKL